MGYGLTHPRATLQTLRSQRFVSLRMWKLDPDWISIPSCLILESLNTLSGPVRQSNQWNTSK